MWRIARENFLQKSRWLVEAAGLDGAPRDSLALLQGTQIERLAAFVGLAPAAVRAMTYHHLAPALVGADVLPDTDVTALIRLRRARACAECLARASYIRLTWQLGLLTACPVHRRLMTDRCGDGTDFLLARRDDPAAFPCGQPIEVGEPVPSSGMAASLHLFAILGGGTARDTRGLIGELDGLRYVRVLQALLPMTSTAAPTRTRNGVVPGETVASLHGRICTLHQALADWPAAFYRLLDECRRGEMLYSQDFGSLPRAVADLVSAGVPQVQEAFQDYLAEHWPGRVEKIVKRLKPERLAARALQTRNQVAKQLGTVPDMITALCEAQEIATVAGRDRRRYIARSEVQRLLEMRRRWLDRTAASRRLGIGENALDHFLKAGLVVGEDRSVVGRSGFWLDGAVVDRLLSDLRRDLPPCPGEDG